MSVLMQTYFSIRISFTEVAEQIMSALSDVDWERGDYIYHVPFKSYDAVFYIGSMMNQDIARYFRYMWWTNRHVYYGVTEGPPILSVINRYAIGNMKMIVPSEYVKWELEQAGIRVDAVIPHGVEIDAIRSVPRDNMWRKTFGDKFVCLYVAHRNLRKGFRELCEAWKLTRASKDPNVLLVLHTSREPNRLSGEDYIIPEEGNIVVTGNVHKLDRESLYGLYRAADLYIHGGLAEGFGIPIVEAMAAGVPVVTLDAKPMSELNRVPEARVRVAEQRVYVDRGVAAYRLNAPDLRDYAEVIDAMVYDDELREEVRAKQQSYVHEYDAYKVYQRFRRWLR